MNDDLIKRKDALNALIRMDGIKIDKALAMGEIRSIPSADRPQGEWIITEQDNGHKWTHRKCSECGKGIIEPLGVSGMNFCPNCGARMKGADYE
jgi:ribosomal protein S27AE